MLHTAGVQSKETCTDDVMHALRVVIKVLFVFNTGLGNAHQSATGGYAPSDVASLPGGMRTSPNFPASAAALRFHTPCPA